MPEQLTKQEVDKSQDPSVTKQYDDSADSETKFGDAFAITDKLRICMFGSARSGIGPVTRAMAVAKRSGPDFLFLANGHSQKFEDLESNLSLCSISFHDSTTQDWVSISGKAVQTSNDEPRIKEVYSEPVKAWFGDLGDGVHTGGPEDPRVKLIEVRAKYISYWKHTVSAEGFGEEIENSKSSGGVAQTGVQRQMKEEEIEEYRKKNSELTK